MMKSTLLLFGLSLGILTFSYAQGFKTKWITSRIGETNENSILIKTDNNLSYNYDVDIDEDGIMDYTSINGDLEIEFDEAGEKIIEIFGQFPCLAHKETQNEVNEIDKLVEVMRWGNIVWERLDRMFMGCDSLNVSATDAPDLSNIESLSFTFAGIDLFQGDINHWDVGNIKSLNHTFCRNKTFNSPLDLWDVSNVTDMAYALDETRKFNQDISGWDVSSVSNAEFMLAGTLNFNRDISTWDVSNVKNFSSMFQESNINQDLTSWDVSSGTNFSRMFKFTSQFNGDISNWDMSNATSIKEMFHTSSFNNNISDWDVSNVTDMHALFYRSQFTSDISSWDVSNVTDMSSLFYKSKFTGDISNWDVSNVQNSSMMFYENSYSNPIISNWNISSIVDMTEMFFEATAFDQDLSNWNFESVNGPNLSNFVSYSGLSVENYDRLLIKMSEMAKHNVGSFGSGLKYCEAEQARDYLINELNWNNLNDEKSCVVNTESLPSDQKIYSSNEGIHLVLHSASDRDIHLALIDMQGRSVASYLHPSGEIQSVFSSSNIPTGMYFIHALGTTSKIFIN